MFRHLPSYRSKVYPDYTSGIVYSVIQTDLKFGSDSHKDNLTRPALLLRQRDHLQIVLPLTSKKTKMFFHLAADKIMRKRKPAEVKDSYVCFRDEVLLADAIGRCRTWGVIEHSLCIDIADWLKGKL